MATDLISLRLLLATANSALAEMLRQAVNQSFVPAEVLEPATSADACSLLGQQNIDLVLLDPKLPDSERASVCMAARAAQNKPFMVSIGEPTASADVDCIMGRPDDDEEARALVDHSIRARIPARVLVVDDSSTMRGIVRRTLQASKFPVRVAEADDGLTALEELRRRQFDIVFLDFNMPGLNGFETMSELRREHPAVGVVIMTSSDNKSFAGRARQAGAAFLKKPFYPSDVDELLYRFHKLDPAVSVGKRGGSK
jgi:DNA-binding response OmpR family regulator